MFTRKIVPVGVRFVLTRDVKHVCIDVCIFSNKCYILDSSGSSLAAGAKSFACYQIKMKFRTLEGAC